MSLVEEKAKAKKNIILSIIVVAMTPVAGVFECPHCGERFVPTATAYVFAMHGITWRRLCCPKCHKKGFCKKKLSCENKE